MAVEQVLGIVAGLMSSLSFILYIRSTLSGQTRPNRATWWILTLIGVMIGASYYAEGARATIWIPVSYVIGPLIVALLSLKYGEGRWERLDKYCLGAALISAVVWYVFDAPLATLLINVFMDFVAVLPTIRKSWMRPEGEDLWAWAVEAFACLLNLLAVRTWTWGVAFYPWYLLIANAAIALILLRGRLLRRPGHSPR